MRTLTRPPTAHCTMPHISFLLSEPHYPSACRLAKLMNISHDSVNRFILRERFTPKDLFDQAKSQLELEGGVLSVDDSVLDKPYSHHMALVGHFWSGKHHRSVKGINLITLHVFAALFGYILLQKMSLSALITNIYALHRDLLNGVIREFIGKTAVAIEGLLPTFKQSYNA